MKMILGKTAGFCFGVANAVNKSEKECERNGKIYCLGELANNKQVIEELEKKGLEIINDLNNVNNTKVIIRAHGVTKETYREAERRKIELIDLTCPKVLKIHKLAEEYSNKNYYIFLIGKKEHPEIVGTISYCGKTSTIIESLADVEDALESFKQSRRNQIAIICQTTINTQRFEEIVNTIKIKLDEDVKLEINNTICEATRVRQEETAEIAKQVNLMLIIGGKNSSNSNKLYEIAKKNCENSMHIETKGELDTEYLKTFNKIGIMAGASTPQKSIEEVVEILNNI